MRHFGVKCVNVSLGSLAQYLQQCITAVHLTAVVVKVNLVALLRYKIV